VDKERLKEKLGELILSASAGLILGRAFFVLGETPLALFIPAAYFLTPNYFLFSLLFFLEFLGQDSFFYALLVSSPALLVSEKRGSGAKDYRNFLLVTALSFSLLPSLHPSFLALNKLPIYTLPAAVVLIYNLVFSSSVTTSSASLLLFTFLLLPYPLKRVTQAHISPPVFETKSQESLELNSEIEAEIIRQLEMRE